MQGQTQQWKITGAWKPVRRTVGYQLALMVVAIVMVLLPLLYLAIIAALGYGLYAYATHSGSIINSGSGRVHGRGAVWLLLLFFTPLFIGGGLILFMLKPLFAPRYRRPDTFTIERSEEPRLYEFVDMVCEMIGAPKPKRIDVDCQVNASASFRSGLLSLLLPGDLVLTIGMPIAAGMTVQQFAGILAHEFGHFSQGLGMRAGRLTWSVQTWFARAAYERDGWDAAIAGLAESANHWFIALVCWILQICTIVAQLVLRALLWISGLASSHMSRQMEFDADKHECRFSGSPCFADTSRRMMELSLAQPEAFARVGQHWRRKMLPDNFAALVADAARRPGARERARVDELLTDKKTGVFDSHPSTASRIAHAKKLDEPGIFHSDAPASSLFSNFNDVCKKATYGHYLLVMGREMMLGTFVPTKDLLEASDDEVKQRQAVAAFVGFEPTDWRPIFLPVNLPLEEEPKRTAERVREMRAKAKSTAPTAKAAVDRFEKADATQQKMLSARAIFDAGFKTLPKALGGLTFSPLQVTAELERTRNDLANACAEMDDALDVASARLAADLALLRLPAVQKRVDKGEERWARTQQLIRAMSALRAIHPHAREMRDNLARADSLSHAYQGLKTPPKAMDWIRATADRVRNHLDDIRRAGGESPWPYDHGDEPQNIGQRLVGATPAHREFAEIFGAGEQVLTRYPADQRRVLGELIEIARAVEAGLSAPRESQ